MCDEIGWARKALKIRFHTSSGVCCDPHTFLVENDNDLLVGGNDIVVG